MKIVDTGDPGILELRSHAAGCVVLAGLFFVIGGAAGIAFGLGMLQFDASIVPELKNVTLAAAGVFVFLGLLFVGGRSGKILDGRVRSLTSWYGVFVPLRRKHQRLEGYSWVVLVKDVRKGKNSSTPFYPVRLEGDGKKVLTIDTVTDSLKARRIAEAVAKTLHLPMSDSTSGEAIIRDPDHLDESLRDRIRRLGERIEMPPNPAATRSQIHITSGEVIAEIPGMSATTRLIVNLVAVVSVLGIGVIFYGTELITGPDGGWSQNLPFLGVAALFVVVPLTVVLAKLRGLNRASRITANRVTLVVVQGGKTTEIPGDKLEELSISGKDISQIFLTRPDGSLVLDPAHQDTPEGATYIAEHGQPPTVPPALAGIVNALARLSPERMSIFACSDRASVRFGKGLDSEEINYLYSAIMKVMVD